MTNLSIIDLFVLAGIVVVGMFIGVILFIALRDIFGTTRATRVRSRLLQAGASAPATIQKVWEASHAVDSTDVVMGFELQVAPPEAASFLAETIAPVGMASLHLFQPGVRVQVCYNPENVKQVALEKLLY
jgi:hypothetical protein